MIRFVALHLRNVLFFKNVSVRLDQQPLTFILGRNWNAGGSTNAAGKSLLFSQIPELLFGEPIVGVKKDRLQNGIVALDLIKDDVPYRIVRTLTKGKEKLKVLRDNKDLEFREIAEARKFVVENLLGCSSEEFETRVYLDVQVPHPLIRGDTAARKRFFTEFFRLNTHEGMLSLIKHEMRQAADAKAQIMAFTESAEATSRQLAEYEQVTEEEIQEHEQKLIGLSDTIEKLRSIAALKERSDSLSSPVVNTARKLVKPFTPDQLQTTVRRLEKKVEAYEEQEAQYEEHAELQVEVKTLKVQLTKLQEQSPSPVDEDRKNKIAARVRKHSDQVRSLRQQIEESEERLSSAHKTPKVCSTCGQPWPHKEHGKVDSAKIKADLKSLKAEYRESVDRHSELEAKMETLNKRDWAFKAHASSLEKAESSYEKKRRALRNVTKVEAPDKDTVNRTREFLSRLENNKAGLKALMKYELLPDTERSRVSNLDKLIAKHLKMVEKLASLKHVAEERAKLEKILKQVHARIAVLEKTAADAENLQLLAQAYSKKGMPTLMIKTICSRLEDVINKYASYVFPEDYSFSFQLDTQFSITVTRKYQGKEVTSDVRKLSGAESKLFSILLLIGLLTFIPESRRTNLLILDEPDASMGQETVDLLLQFLKVLNKIVPNIIVITPRNYDPGEEANIMTVVKKGTESKLVEGRA